MSDLRKIIIDDQEIEVDGAMTLIQACEQVGVEVPRFCYHERLFNSKSLYRQSPRQEINVIASKNSSSK